MHCVGPTSDQGMSVTLVLDKVACRERRLNGAVSRNNRKKGGAVSVLGRAR